MIADHIALPKPLDFILYHVFLYTFWVEGIYFQRKIHKFIPKALDLRIFDILTSWAFRIYGSFLRKMPSVYLDFRKAWSAKWSPIMIVIWSLRILTKWSWVIVDHIMVKVSWVIVDHEKCDRTLLCISHSSTKWKTNKKPCYMACSTIPKIWQIVKHFTTIGHFINYKA